MIGSAPWGILLLSSVTIIMLAILAYYNKKLKEVDRALNELRNIIDYYCSFSEKLAEVKAKNKNRGELTSNSISNSKSKKIKIAEKPEAITMAEVATRFNFNIKDIYVPRIMVTSTNSLTIYESRPFRRRFKKFIYVETDAPSQLAFNLRGDIDKFDDLRIIVYNKKTRTELNKVKREAFIILRRAGKYFFDILIEGVSKRVDSDTIANISVSIELSILQHNVINVIRNK